MTDPNLHDAFGPTANPKAYVPRPATERALDHLVASITAPQSAVALTGPPGIGKTLLLRVLPSRLPAEIRSVYLPYAALTPEDIATLAMAELEGHGVASPVAALRAFLDRLRETGGALLLRIDDATSMPPPTARWLAEFARESGGVLRILLGAVDDPDTDRVIASIGERVDVVRLVEPMTESEAHRYVAGKLAFADASEEVLARFDEATVSRLYEISAGMPVRLNAAATAVARGADPKVYQAIVGVEERAEAAPPASADLDESDETPEPLEQRELPLEGGFAPDEEERELRQLRFAARRPPERRVEPPPSLREVARTVLVLVLAVAAIGFLRAYAATPLVGAATRDAAPALPPVEAPPPFAAGPQALEPVPGLAGAGEGGADVAGAGAGPFEVQINATPWAEIEIDGVPVGETPLAGIPLLAGPHVVRARMADGRILERTVEIDAENRFIAFR